MDIDNENRILIPCTFVDYFMHKNVMMILITECPF